MRTLALAGMFVLAFAAGMMTAPAPLEPCATEDSAGPCVWDAQHRGNGTGRSFVVTADQRIVYLTR